MSLADELIADLDDLGEEEEEIEENKDKNDTNDLLNDLDDLDDTDNDENQNDSNSKIMDLEEEKEMAIKEALTGKDDIQSVAKLASSKKLKDIMEKIEYFKSIPRTEYHNTGPVEEDPEYDTIVKANNMTADIDDEILIIHKYIRDHYQARFPELESLIPQPMNYIRAVKEIGDTADLTQVDLRKILPSEIVMIVAVTATTSIGQPLSKSEINKVLDACDMAFKLEADEKKIFEYVESRMSFIAPNISIIVGSSTAAKLMGVAGGLTALSKIPACNIQVLGATKKTNTGLSAAGVQRHTGFIYYSDIINRTPPEYKMKATRLVAAKVTLAARIDRSRESMDGSVGRKLLEEVEKKIEKMQEPPPGKTVKALPIPDDGPKKRRGGKRVRRMKESYAVTELRRAQNRMTFGVQEDEVSGIDSTEGLGLIRQQSGRIRAFQNDPRTKVKLNPKRQRMMGGSSGATSGLSSSIAFTPVQGIELENPETAQQKLKEISERYFSGFKSKN
ncbi:Nop domain-containing protein [Anaeromyces robustus]|uniref:Nop domain-containing protein n=1 Tax=Anaeromyces robustus TaxID=1754192 RepID=A0A1Y1XCE0_9FUNG|nr:Nop domain-containing protein [Anaeromyces robustus]|eukprot:ORX83034.1 Nop domain-containing protein [Anaeromyces robustus]